MGDPKSSRAKQTTTLRNKFESEKRHPSYASPSNHSQEGQMEMEEIVKYMSNLPSYLERGKPIQDRALNFGVMDWGRLEKWQYNRQSNNYLPSSSKSSSFFSTGGSSPLKFQDFEDATKPRSCKTNDFCPQDLPESESSNDTERSSKGKMKVEDPSFRTCDRDRFDRHKTIVLPGTVQINNEKNDTKHRKSSEKVHSDPNNDILSSFQEEKKSDSKTGAVAASKPRTISPYRRFSFSTGSKSLAPSKRAGSPPVAQNSTKDNNTSVTNRSHSSPLRRLFDPIFPSKATTPEDSKVKAKLKLDLRSCKEVNIDDSCINKQALFQMAVKNGRPLFTFAVDNNRDILAATVRSLTRKDAGNSWIYTFFIVREVKEKTGGWLTQSGKGKGKGKGHGFVPNVTAQMKVSNNGNCMTREFVLFSVDPTGFGFDHEVLGVEPKDELAAIVVRFLEAGEDRFSTTVILPGGNHSVPSKGEPSPLIDRWRSGGACDCGGWDMGCRLRTLANPVQSSGRLNTNGRFELFFQGEVLNERPFFILSPLKDGIFSVEYNSSLSLLHAFSICISVMECQKSSQCTQLKTYVAKQVDSDDEGPVTHASLPPISFVERV